MRLIEGKNLSLGYEGKPILEHLSFFIDSGDYLCIVGDNGSGKSTFVKTLLGLVEPLSGTIEFLNGLKKNEIGYLPQQSLIQRDFPSSVMEVVISGCLNRHHRLFGYSKEEKANAIEVLKRLGIYDLRKVSFQELSGGQQQRVLLARALMATEKLLLLDEPVSGLDPKTVSEFYSLVEELNKAGITIVMITHDIHPALNNARTILHISQGKFFFGNKSDYFTSLLGKEFLEEAGHGDSSC